MSWVAIDGSLVRREEATVSVYDRGFLYGDSIFETLRTYDGALFRLREHVERLRRSAEITRIALPLTDDEMADELVRLTAEASRSIEASGARTEVTARVLVTRGESSLGLLPNADAKPRRVTYLEPFRAPRAELYESGAAVLLVPTYRPSDAARGAKVGNYLESLLALMRAREAGADEALVVDAAGDVVEGTTSNLFVARGGLLETPPVASGLLPGITRGVVMELARDLGFQIDERTLGPTDVLGCDEAFLTSTLRGIMPIGAIEGAAGKVRKKPGPITLALRERFASLVGSSSR